MGQACDKPPNPEEGTEVVDDPEAEAIRARLRAWEAVASKGSEEAEAIRARLREVEAAASTGVGGG
jgi:hypothetical protein